MSVSVSGSGVSGSSGTATIDLSTTSPADVRGTFTVNGAEVTPSIDVIGGSSDFTANHYARDSTGKSASIFASILAAQSFDYRDWVYAGDGSSPLLTPDGDGNIDVPAPSTVALVAAGQRINVQNARYIQCSASAQSSDGKTAMVGTTIDSNWNDANLNNYLGVSAATSNMATAKQSIDYASSESGVTTISQASKGVDIFSVTSRGGYYSGSATAEGSDTNTHAEQNIGYSGINYYFVPIVENYRKTMATGEQKVTLTADRSGYISGLATSSADTHIIQNMVNLAYIWNQDHLTLSSGTFKENVYVDRSLLISGNGKGSTIVDGQASGSVFRVASGTNVGINGLTITNGKAVSGAGIYNEGTLAVTDSEIAKNVATGLHSTANPNDGMGGGIFNAATGSLTLTRDTITSNTAAWGAGISNLGTANIYGGIIGGSAAKANIASQVGGGIENEGVLNVNKDATTNKLAVISYNQAVYGGGIYNFADLARGISGTATINNAQIQFNKASYMGGGIHNIAGATAKISGSFIDFNSAGAGMASGYGGAIGNYGQLIVDQCSLTGNYAKTYGGAIFSYGAITGGKKTKTQVTNSQIMLNKAGRGGAFVNRFVSNVIFTESGNTHLDPITGLETNTRLDTNAGEYIYNY